MAPLAFQSDPDGTYHDLAVQLRNMDVEDFDEHENPFPIVESVDAPEETPSRTAKEKPPGRSSGTSLLQPATPARLEALRFKRQQATITAWIDDLRHVASDTYRHILELYSQLNDSEFLYVTDLQVTYDEARCFFLQLGFGKGNKGARE